MQYAITLEPQRDYLDARHLPALVELWLDYKVGRTDPTTVAGYRINIARALHWWAETGEAVAWRLDRRALDDFALWLTTAQSPTTGKAYGWHAQAGALRRLRQCLHWAHDNGYIPIDCSKWVPKEPLSNPPELRRRIALKHLAALIDAAGHSNAPVRDQAMLATFIGTGVRRAELLGINIEDLQFDSAGGGTAVIHEAKRVRDRVVQGRMVAFDGWTGGYLRAWLDERPDQGPLWVRLRWDYSLGYTSERMSLKTVNRIVARAIEWAGLGGVIQGPHDLRRAFATWFAAQNVRNELAGRVLSKQLGHSTMQMTDHYIAHDAEDLRDVIRSPLATFDDDN